MSAIDEAGFAPMASLRVVDLAGCDVQHFPLHAFQGAHKLSHIYASNYQLCCPTLLPTGFNAEACTVDQDPVSSCENLFHSALQQRFLWILTAACLIVNGGQFVTEVYYWEQPVSSGTIFFLNLMAAHQLSGIHHLILLIADELFRGEFLLHDLAWRSGGGCSVVAFLSLTCSVVSSLMVAFLTLDCCLQMLPRPWRMVPGIAAVSAVLSWTVAGALAVVSLLPPVSQQHRRSSLCNPLALPFVRAGLPPSSHIVVVVVMVFSLALSLLTAAGLVYVRESRAARSVVPLSSKCTDVSSALAAARRLSGLTMLSVACRCVGDGLGLLTLQEQFLSPDLAIALALFVSPINAAFTPVLYTYGSLMEKRRVQQEEAILKSLKANLAKQRKQQCAVAQ
jgi:hypothetical protein